MIKKTGLIFFPAFDWAISATHPEREERLLYTRDQMFEEGILDLPEIVEYSPRLASEQDIARVHFCVPGVADQVVEAHRIAAGATLNLGDRIMAGEIHNGFALVRPPGHHAMRVVHGNRGFCNINNEAILIEYLRRAHGVKKIAIVDTDVHHGDGTQDIFYHDPDVLFISFHQDGRTLYPGTGFTYELGGPGAYARTINIPLPPGATDASLHYVVDNLILPILKEWQPDFIVNSAGQDNHFTDPLGNMRITAHGYARLTEKLKPNLAVLEGGYAIETALPYVNLAILLALAGRDYSYVIEPEYALTNFRESPSVTSTVRRVVEELQEVWATRHSKDKFELAGGAKFYQRNKPIYYDTQFIEEKQIEKVKVCTDCPGYITIDSQAYHPNGRRYHIYAVTIPIQACKACQEEGWQAYEQAKGDYRYNYVYLQDKSIDTFMTHQREEEREIRSDG
ncbi:histone deacetylase superfamily [Desulfotomaculum nigrificans CO-1-SRB]|uniref:Histone deacetylase superfamily n=1 Tax=Desulfotomaculum nigrificans (strain DSM 14880 / VKM B-2319 / CO-1-SRB) TaxID=868595 RepID=F6B5E6_DESCC|nr:histone deacetylase [Desulfotomaculum nigrificans]AEF94267.1 histone deacetylase superfamily [Desulfotomaculum nigrificans CO-1-SRB]